MSAAVDAILEAFTWVGFGAGALLAVVAVVVWASDGTWLAADAIVDHEAGGGAGGGAEGVVVRWFDGDGDANSATLGGADAAALGAADTVTIWYRHGWHGRARLTRRPQALRAVVIAALAMAGLGVVALVIGWVLLFVRG